MEKNNDYSRLRRLLDEIFGFSDSYTSFSSIRLNSSNISVQSDGYPKEDDKNFNKTEEITETETHKVKKETWVSLDGTQTYVRTISESKAPPKSVGVTKEKLERLLDEAIRKQEFEEAARIRDEIKAMK
jgi:excinuclease UvrABC helicase subunit UvrB